MNSDKISDTEILSKFFFVFSLNLSLYVKLIDSLKLSINLRH